MLDHPTLYDLLSTHNFTEVIFQIGYGKHEPKAIMRGSLNIIVHRFVVLDELIKRSSLVISHCGAGILLESLRSNSGNEVNTRCIAVVNDSLMANH